MMATKKKKAKRPAKQNASKRKTKKAAKKAYKSAHARAGIVYKKAKPARKGRSAPNPAKRLRANLKKMKPGAWYDSTLQGAKVKVKKSGGNLVIRPA
jgi:hypothetical protein